METANMVKILELIQNRWLELLAERLTEDEKDTHMKAYFDTRSGVVDLERLREAEDIVMDVVGKFGKLIVFGDQLTVSN